MADGSAPTRPAEAVTLVIMPDIFGITPALENLAEELKATLEKRSGLPGPLRLKILNPYTEGRYFEDEPAAYAYFTRRTDIPGYGRKLESCLKRLSGPAVILGFSAGASAVWHLAGTSPPPRILGAVCFYGSQIRNFSGLTPGFEICHIFAESEPHFSVDALMATLEKTPRTSCETAPGSHGFMNAFSDNFSQDLYRQFVNDVLPEKLTAMTARQNI